MALRKMIAVKTLGIETDFPIKFSRISAKDSSAAKISHSLGLKMVDSDAQSLKLPGSRQISKVVVYRALGEEERQGHWSMTFSAMKSPGEDKPLSPEEKLIRIDLVQTSYRIVYNAGEESNPGLTATEYKFEGTQPTAQDIYRIVVDVAKQKGRWEEKGYNCQDFVNAVLQRLATLGSASNWKL
jgi:hypothetical protein